MQAAAAPASFSLDAVLERLAVLEPGVREKLERDAAAATQDMPWVPNPGMQTDVWFSEADEIGLGGEAGPGKTDVVVGLSLCKHQRSLVLRRENKQAKKLLERYQDILGHERGLNRSEGYWRLPSKRLIEVGGCEHEDDKQKRKGNPYDLIAFDEVVDFTRTMYEFIIQWNRSTDPGQRCRVVATFNPPTKAVGLWVIERWGAWLDPKHPRPAKSGEIRWFTVIDGKDTEVDGRGPHIIPGESKPVMAKSRTFIRGRLEENPDLANTGYDATRAAAPKGMREAYRDGDFEKALADVPNQVIPTAWVRAAQARWTSQPPTGIPMCSIAADCTGGGDDPLMVGWRHDAWFSELVEVPGKQIPMNRLGSYTAGVIISYRREDANIILDMGGGYGGAAYEWLDSNGMKAHAYKGAEKTTRRTRDKKLGFVNKRSAAIWGMREALDPGQPGGSPVALPNDSQLTADLTSPTFTVGPRGIEVESKRDVCDRLGRSTDKGDTVVMLWWDGPRMATAALEWAGRGDTEQGRMPGGSGASRARYPKQSHAKTSRSQRR